VKTESGVGQRVLLLSQKGVIGGGTANGVMAAVKILCGKSVSSS